MGRLPGPAEIQDGKVSLYSRNQISLNKKFFPIAEALQQCGFEAVLDGEIVVVDEQGRPNFQMLQNYQNPAAATRSTTSSIYYTSMDMT